MSPDDERIRRVVPTGSPLLHKERGRVRIY
jgi:hypothetical protein